MCLSLREVEEAQLPAIIASGFSVTLEHGVSMRVRNCFLRRNLNAHHSRLREFIPNSAGNRRDVNRIATVARILDEVVSDPRFNLRVRHRRYPGTQSRDQRRSFIGYFGCSCSSNHPRTVPALADQMAPARAQSNRMMRVQRVFDRPTPHVVFRRFAKASGTAIRTTVWSTIGHRQFCPSQDIRMKRLGILISQLRERSETEPDHVPVLDGDK